MNFRTYEGLRLMGHSQNAVIAVLVVEDEPILRIDIADCLAEAGFKVYEADGADEAIRVLEQHEDIRFLFTDVEMPGSMDGIKLAHYVRGRWPPVKIIIVSGYPIPRREDMPPESVFFGKPYGAAHVISKLREIADADAHR
jgi:two-component system, response regulator PdtaR